MIRPTIGRVVWYYSNSPLRSNQPWAAIICYVHSDTMVNLVVFDENGFSKPKPSVFLYQGDIDRPNVPYCEWMPYQIGQAKANPVTTDSVK